MRETRRQTIIGTVVSDKMDKTVVIEVERTMQHPRYKKFIRSRKKYKAHDENNECRLGDVVKIMGTRPISKDKTWRVAEIMKRRYVSTAQIQEVDAAIIKGEKETKSEAE